MTVIGGYDHQPYVDPGGILYGAVVGYDAAAGRARLGAEAEVSGATGEQCTQLSAATRRCDTRGRNLYVGGRAGVVAGPVLLYGKAGYTNLRENAEISGPLPAGSAAASYSSTIGGYRVGAGVETSIGRVPLRLEYRYSDYGRYGDRHQLVAGVGLRF